MSGREKKDGVRARKKKSFLNAVLSVREGLGGCCCVGAGENSKRQQEGQEAQVLDLVPLSPEHRIPQGLQKCPEGTAVPHLAQARRPAGVLQCETNYFAPDMLLTSLRCSCERHNEYMFAS